MCHPPIGTAPIMDAGTLRASHIPSARRRSRRRTAGRLYWVRFFRAGAPEDQSS
jgi:hypothetical protein